jgi:hypothetical protein
MQVSITGTVAFGKFDWEGGAPGFKFFDYTPNGKEFVKVADHTVTVDVPDDFDPRSLMVQSLEQEKQKLTAAFQARITEINGQIQNLLAIEHTPEEVAS